MRKPERSTTSAMPKRRCDLLQLRWGERANLGKNDERKAVPLPEPCGWREQGSPRRLLADPADRDLVCQGLRRRWKSRSIRWGYLPPPPDSRVSYMVPPVCALCLNKVTCTEYSSIELTTYCNCCSSPYSSFLSPGWDCRPKAPHTCKQSTRPNLFLLRPGSLSLETKAVPGTASISSDTQPCLALLFLVGMQHPVHFCTCSTHTPSRSIHVRLGLHDAFSGAPTTKFLFFFLFPLPSSLDSCLPLKVFLLAFTVIQVLPSTIQLVSS